MKELSQLFTSKRVLDENENIPSLTNNIIKTINNQYKFVSFYNIINYYSKF